MQYAEDYRLNTQGRHAKQELNLLSALLALKPAVRSKQGYAWWRRAQSRRITRTDRQSCR